jgi:hypothetical protein
MGVANAYVIVSYASSVLWPVYLLPSFGVLQVGGRIKGGVAAEMQSAAAKLHAAIEQASTVGVGATANSVTNAASNENGAAPPVTITGTVDADDLIKHAADVKVSIIARSPAFSSLDLHILERRLGREIPISHN